MRNGRKSGRKGGVKEGDQEGRKGKRQYITGNPNSTFCNAFCLPIGISPVTALTNYPKLDDLKQQFYCFTVLEARGPKSRC